MLGSQPQIKNEAIWNELKLKKKRIENEAIREFLGFYACYAKIREREKREWEKLDLWHID